METPSGGFSVKILLDCSIKFLQPVLKRVLHREEARKPSKELLTSYFRAVLESAKAKKTIGSSIPEVLLETNNWTFYVQSSHVQNLLFHRAHLPQTRDGQRRTR